MMRFTEILDSAFSLYRRHYRLFFWLNILNFVCSILLIIVFEFPDNKRIPDFFDRIISSLSFTLICGLMIIMASEIYLGQQITFKQMIQRYLKQFVAYFGCSIIYVLLPILPDLFPDSDTVTSTGLTIIMIVVWIIGYPIIFYLLICWIFYGPVLLIENKTIIEVFRRSRYLVYGKWWRVFWNVIKLLFFMLSINLIITISFVILLQMFGFFESEMSFRDVINQQLRLLFVPDHTPTSVADWIITIFDTAIDVWLTPIYAISITILYFDHCSQKVDYGSIRHSHH